MNNISFNGIFYTTARMKRNNPLYKKSGFDIKEKELATEFKLKTLDEKGYILAASDFDKFDSNKIKFILLKGKESAQGTYDFNMNVNQLVEIFNSLKSKLGRW